MKRVYVIWNNRFDDGTNTIYDIYSESAKEEAKKKVDELNDDLAARQDEDGDYTLEAFDLNEGSKLGNSNEDDLK